jgi:hypothetical protein
MSNSQPNVTPNTRSIRLCSSLANSKVVVTAVLRVNKGMVDHRVAMADLKVATVGLKEVMVVSKEDMEVSKESSKVKADTVDLLRADTEVSKADTASRVTEAHRAAIDSKATSFGRHEL